LFATSVIAAGLWAVGWLSEGRPIVVSAAVRS
jgi:hypothetical protein